MPVRVRPGLNCEQSRLAISVIDKIKPTVGIRYNLAWTYGDYLNDLPRRLGTNVALDSATEAFLLAVKRSMNRQEVAAPIVLERYGVALTALRNCLDDPVKAREPETLGAILLLMNCQVSTHFFSILGESRLSTTHSNTFGLRSSLGVVTSKVQLRS